MGQNTLHFTELSIIKSEWLYFGQDKLYTILQHGLDNKSDSTVQYNIGSVFRLVHWMPLRREHGLVNVLL